jgi:prevent-host-death family protein
LQGDPLVKSIKASEFKAKCLQIMDEVAESGEAVVITKNGRPVAQLGPVVSRRKTLAGLHKGQIRIVGDIIEPIDAEWEALR